MATMLAEMRDEWSRIHDRDCPLVLEDRHQPLDATTIAPLLARAPFTQRAEGSLTSIAEQLTALPASLVADVVTLARRFAGLMNVDDVRIRIEGITGNACTKMHADYADVRLITTYAGPGTDYMASDDACCPKRVPQGWIGLFKGKTYGYGHPPCLHRSPAVAETGERRLVLVIDTPSRPIDISSYGNAI